MTTSAEFVRVVIGKEYIWISDKGGEIVYWHSSEWHEDPDVVFSIANAIRIAYTEGPAKLRGMLDHI